jgi:hypothetical protein
VSRFLNDQIFTILRGQTFPRAELFEHIQRGALPGVDAPLAEKRAAILLQLRIGEADLLWACADCSRVIGLIDAPPQGLLAEFERNMPLGRKEIMSNLFLLYASRERLRCPCCQSESYLILAPTFLVSGLPLQSQIPDRRPASE